MALSNWDTLAFDRSGPCAGRVTNAAGVAIEIYKNWLYLHDRRKHDTAHGDRYLDEVIGKIHEGNLDYGHWTIRARRGPQDGVYVVAWSSQWRSLPGSVGEHIDQALLVGCGVSGFQDESELYAAEIASTGVDPMSVFTTSTFGEGEERRQLMGRKGGENTVIVDGMAEIEWEGVRPDSLTYLRTMAEEIIAEHTYGLSSQWQAQALGEIDWDGALRANQGDLYFAARGAITDLPATKPGDAARPVMLDMIEQMT